MSMAVFGMGETVEDFGALLEIEDFEFNLEASDELEFSLTEEIIHFEMEIEECPTEI